jgi:hypothetical protein
VVRNQVKSYAIFWSADLEARTRRRLSDGIDCSKLRPGYVPTGLV